MANIREKRPGVWEVRVFTGRDASGRPIQVSQTVRGTKRDARLLAARLTLRPAPSATRRTVAELLDEFVAHRSPTWAIQTRAAYAGRVARIKNDPIAAMAIARVGVKDIDSWILRMRQAGVRDPSLKNFHSTLCAAFEEAVRWEWLTHNVVRAARPKIRRQPPREAMTPDDVRAVLDAAAQIDPAAALALRLAATVGARRSELVALRWENFRDGLVVIDHQIIPDRTVPADSSDRYVYGPTKTANRRLVSIDERTAKLVIQLRLERQAVTPWLFGLGERPPAPDRIGWWWTRARKLAGIDPSWRLHDLRHFSATQSIANGHDIRTVAARLGHADASMTMRVYAHAVVGRDRQVAETMARLLGG